jgi:tRNA dimethylallyltransferase
MVQNGWVQEVKGLLQAGFTPDDPGFRAIGYRTFAEHLAGSVGLEEAIAKTIAETRRYAKRQRTWIRSEPNATLIDPDSLDARLKVETLVRSLSG